MCVLVNINRKSVSITLYLWLLTRFITEIFKLQLKHFNEYFRVYMVQYRVVGRINLIIEFTVYIFEVVILSNYIDAIAV